MYLKERVRTYVYTGKPDIHVSRARVRATRIPPSYVYIHLCYPCKAKEAVCALNIDFKRKPCYETAVKKGRIRQTFKFPFLLQWKTVSVGRAGTMD